MGLIWASRFHERGRPGPPAFSVVGPIYAFPECLRPAPKPGLTIPSGGMGGFFSKEFHSEVLDIPPHSGGVIKDIAGGENRE